VELVGYVRVSRVAGREGESFISPDVQRERIEAAARAGGHRVVEWQTDLDEPGSRSDRPGFQAAIEAVESGRVGGIAVASLDRFARSVPDAAVALRRIDDAGGTLISARDALDTSTPVGRFARTMMLAIAELELERIRENWRVATERAIGRGVHVSRVPPFGYTRGDDGRLVPDRATARIVRELFARRARGDSWRSLCEWLDDVAPRQGAWAIQTVGSIIRNRVYLGEARSGDLVNRDAHPALVTRAEWEAAQPSEGRPSIRTSGSLLAGLVVCASCGQAMTTYSAGRSGYRSYICRKRTPSGVCPAPTSISMRKLDAFVEDAFLAWLAAHPVRSTGVAASEDAEEVLVAIEAAEVELATYRDASLVSVIGVDAYREGLAVRSEVLERERARYAEIQRRAPERLVGDLATLWPDLERAQRARVLREAIERIVVERGESATGGGRPAIEGRVRIHWRPDVAREALA
jgi:site-specific DNA recombinase